MIEERILAAKQYVKPYLLIERMAMMWRIPFASIPML